MLTEMERFVAAFERLMARGEFPTPTKLNLEMGRPGSRNNLPGRLSLRRRELLKAAGYDKGLSQASHWRRWSDEMRMWCRNPTQINP